MFKKGLTGFTVSTLLLACAPTSVLEAKIRGVTNNTFLKEGNEALYKETKLRLEENDSFFSKHVSVRKTMYFLLAMYFVSLVEKFVVLRLTRNELRTKYRTLRSKLDDLNREESELFGKKSELDLATKAQKERLWSKNSNEKLLSDINVEFYTKKLKECKNIIEEASNNKYLVKGLTIRTKKGELSEFVRKYKCGHYEFKNFEHMKDYLQSLLNEFNGTGILEHRRYLISKSIFNLTDVEVNDAVNALINKKEEYSRESSKHYWSSYDENDLSSLKDFKEIFATCKKALKLAKEIEDLQNNGRYFDEAEIFGTLSKVADACETISNLTSTYIEFDFIGLKFSTLFGFGFDFDVESFKKLTPLVKSADDGISRVEEIKSEIAKLSSTINEENKILETLRGEVQKMEEKVRKQREDLESNKEYKSYEDLLKKKNELENNFFKFTFPGQYTIFS